MFFCEYCEIYKNTYFEEHQRTAASVLLIIKLLIKYRASVDLFLIKNIIPINGNSNFELKMAVMFLAVNLA